MSSNWSLVFIVALAIGAALFGIGSAILRSSETVGITWTRAITGDDRIPKNAERREMIARLALIDADWAREALAQAREQERE